MTIEEFASTSGYSSRQLHRWFDDYLDTWPSWTINTSTPIYLLIDGTYYSDDQLLVYLIQNQSVIITEIIELWALLDHNPITSFIGPFSLNNALRFQFGDLLINATP